MIRVCRTGLIYRNPSPHVHSVQAYFPSVAPLGGGRMLASLVLGEAFEAPNARTHTARSADAGETWKLEGPVYPGTRRRLTSDSARLTVLPDGQAVLFMVRADRSAHPDEGLANPKTLGFVPTELLLLRSSDQGRTWSAPRLLRAPLKGPEFELCSPITPLRDGRWILPTSTWNDWRGRFGPEGKCQVALVSRDQGRTWPEFWKVMTDARQRYRFWEGKIAELPDGRLLSVAWVYDEPAGRDLPNHFALSADGGRTWSRPESMGIRGQTLTPWVLEDGRVLCVYRRMDRPGLWAILGTVNRGRWITREQVPLWGVRAAGLTRRSRDMVHNFAVLRFGAPCICRAPDGFLFVAFWCYEDGVSNIRWLKLRV